MKTKFNATLLMDEVYRKAQNFATTGASVPALRISTDEWKWMLLNNKDTMISLGKGIKLTGTRVGPGVYEVKFNNA